MATFTWTTGVGGNWGTGVDWSPTTGAPPGRISSNVDLAVLGQLTHNYTVTVAAGTTFDINRLNIGTTGGAGAPSLAIDGTLLTSTLDYTTKVIQPTIVHINSGGLLEIRTSILYNGLFPETLTISGENAGGHLELGSLSVFNPNVHVSFEDGVAHELHTGVVGVPVRLHPWQQHQPGGAQCGMGQQLHHRWRQLQRRHSDARAAPS